MFRATQWPPPSFEARLLASSWVIPLGLLGLGALLALLPLSSGWATVGGAGLIGLALVIARLRWVSRITLVGSELTVSFFSPRTRSVSLARLAGISSRASKASLGLAPALEIRSTDGRAATVRLGWWRREPELLGLLDDAARRSTALLDPQTEKLLRDRPSGESWSIEQRQAHEAAKHPPNRLQRLLQRLPAPVRWLSELALFAIAIVGIYAVFEGAVRLSENVLFPRQIDPAWATQVDLPPGQGDSWVGNLASDGDRIYLAARQTVMGFWGTIAVWSSADGGLTWAAPTVVSRHAWPDTARHALAIAPDGTLFVGFAEQGPQPVTQRLIVRTSRDGGRSWSEGVPVSPTRVGLIGLPVFLLTPEARMVAFTDGETGDVLVQRLTADGAPDGEPAQLGRTTRQLYSDADFHDAAIALSTAQGRVVAVWVEGAAELRASVSTDGGVSWMPSTGLDQELYGGRPRLATDGTTVLLAATDPSRGARYVRHPFIRIWRSGDGGATFERGPDVTDVEDIGSLELMWADGRWRLVYDACPGFISCATPPRVWYAESADGDHWPEPSVISEAGPVWTLGLAISDDGLAAVWSEQLGPHNWDFFLALRDR